MAIVKCDFCGKEYDINSEMISYGEMNLTGGSPEYLRYLAKGGIGLGSELLWEPVDVCDECWRRINNFIVENLIPKE